MKKKLNCGGVAAAVLFISALGLATPSCGKEKATETAPTAEAAGEKSEDGGKAVELSAEAVKAAGIQTAEIDERESVAVVIVTGTVEANQEKMQQVTPLVSGRVERVNVVLGERVKQDAILAVISSPEVAEMHGKLHEAETRLNLGRENLERVQRAENRSAVLQAKARLDEADANLRRTRRLIELGAAAGKDLIAAETASTSAKAEYEYQSNISLNREVQAARAEVETTQVEVSHLRNSLGTLGASIVEAQSGNPHDTSVVTLRAPAAGIVIDRLVNAGAGIEPGKSIFTIADISTLWVIANVPEGRISQLRVGTPAEVRSAELGQASIAGRVAYIDPVLNEQTRTGRVRIEIGNPGERLKVGMFVEVQFRTSGGPSGNGTGKSLLVPDNAVQRIGDRTVVFIPSDTPGRYDARDLQLGKPVNGFHPVLSGLKAGERVVTDGSFVLKTQLMKGELGEE